MIIVVAFIFINTLINCIIALDNYKAIPLDREKTKEMWRRKKDPTVE